MKPRVPFGPDGCRRMPVLPPGEIRAEVRGGELATVLQSGGDPVRERLLRAAMEGEVAAKDGEVLRFGEAEGVSTTMPLGIGEEEQADDARGATPDELAGEEERF